ncbi:MAG: hypothetical protein IJU71_11185 [Selenomonadaceae bacterium]|nr:hypothetical protein [Selenomonadaceae bacterium]
MSGTVAAFDEQFRDKQGNAVGLIPPLHPRCRCVVYYRRLLPPGLNDITPTAMSTPNTSPYLLGRVDPNDGEQLAAVIRHYEERIANQSIENAIIITAYGEVYHTTGDLNTVNPILLLGNKLNGATVTHNHPRDSANEYSFSGNDIELFMSHSIERLRGIDERFVYELNRNPQDSDVGSVTVEDMADGFGYRHFKVMEKAEELGIGYRRWRHE